MAQVAFGAQQISGATIVVLAVVGLLIYAALGRRR